MYHGINPDNEIIAVNISAPIGKGSHSLIVSITQNCCPSIINNNPTKNGDKPKRVPVIFLTKNCIRLMRGSFLSEKYLSTRLSFSVEAWINGFSVIEIC